MSRNNFFRGAGLAAVLFAVGFLLPALRAQPAESTVHGRYLFIIDTSSNMKNRVPALQKTLITMLATSLGGQLHTGDTIGVWTFNQDLHPGDVPLQIWDANDAAVIAANLAQFIGSQKYANKTRFEALQPLLNQVVKGSERLTVVIFCDGATKITGTTFDTGINQLFEQNVAAQKKARQPFIVLLRSQQGKYIGCTVSYPPQLVSFPNFPPLPTPPSAPKPLPIPPPLPTVVAPSLIINGTNIESHLASPLAKPAPANPVPAIEPGLAPVAPTNMPAIAPVALTNLVVAPPVTPALASAAPPNVPVIVSVSTNPPAIVLPVVVMVPVSIVPTNNFPAQPTNVPVVAVENEAAAGKNWPAIALLFFIAAGGVTGLAIFRRRRSERRSLISQSMHDR